MTWASTRRDVPDDLDEPATVTDAPVPPHRSDRSTDDERSALREAGRRARQALTATERAARSAEIRSSVVALLGPAEPGRSTVALFVATDGEPDLTPLAGDLRDLGWTVALPVVGPGRTMAFHRWDADDPLAPNRFGVDEPTSRIVVRPEVVVVPCVAVDADGNRLGFGKGFYDRALADGRPWAVGAVFDAQVVATVPCEPWDVPLDAVVTPTRTLRTGR